ncbi:unnamed protein product, partial [marine sediment metagenome]
MVTKQTMTPEHKAKLRKNIKIAQEARKKKREMKEKLGEEGAKVVEKGEELKSEEAVTIPKILLESLQKRLGILEQIADKKQLAAYLARHKEEMPGIVKLRMIDDKVILGWKTIRDEVFEDAITRKW